MTGFTAPLRIEFDQRASELLHGTYFRTLTSFHYIFPPSVIESELLGKGSAYVHVPAGILTDLGTIPPVARSYVNPAGPEVQAFVLHDQLCEYLSITVDGRPFDISRERADLILREALININIPAKRAELIYQAVRIYAKVNSIKTRSSINSLNVLKRELESQRFLEGV